MSNAPMLLNDDGTASMATALMMSHHGFRRDLVRFTHALATIAAGDASRAEAVREEWQNFRTTLHGHHDAEDNGVFPNLASEHDSVRATIDNLGADHRRIDPLLFAWAMHGIASDVLERVYEMLPESVRAKLPAARAVFEARCERVWGSARAGAARSPMPDAIRLGA